MRSLTALVLCQKHNNELTALDSVAKEFFSAIQIAQLSLQAKSIISTVVKIDGDLLERWILKLVAGFLASENFARGGQKVLGDVQVVWKKIILGESFPYLWGLYFTAPQGEFATAHKEFEVTPLSDPSGQIRAVTLGMARIPMFFALGRPDDPQSVGSYRPEGLVFHDQIVHHRIEFTWADGPWCKPQSYQRLRDA